MRESFKLHFGKENRVIRGDVYFDNETHEKKPVILLIHGFKGFKDWAFFPPLAQNLAENGFVVVSFNFSMNGIGEDLENYTELEKFGRLTYSREQEDINFVLQHIKTGNIPFAELMDVDQIGLFGHSRGGGNSILFALEHPGVKCTVVWNSIHRVKFFDETVLQAIEQNGVGYIPHARTGQEMPITREVIEDIDTQEARFHILNRLPQLTTPLLIIQGDSDHPSLVAGAPRMAEAAPHATLHMIEGADHTMGVKHPFTTSTPHFEEALEETLRFYTNHLLN